MNIKTVRLFLQGTALFFQVYFFIETLRLYSSGYILFAGEAIESYWFSMLFTLLVVVATEFLNLIDSVIYIVLKRNIYSVVNLVLLICNAVLFISLAYYTTVGTVICITFYIFLFIVRIVNFILGMVKTFKKV